MIKNYTINIKTGLIWYYINKYFFIFDIVKIKYLFIYYFIIKVICIVYNNIVIIEIIYCPIL